MQKALREVHRVTEGGSVGADVAFQGSAGSGLVEDSSGRSLRQCPVHGRAPLYPGTQTGVFFWLVRH